MNHSPTAKPDAKPTEGAQGSANSKTHDPINTHRRLFDLVRNCRAQLHEEDLITDDEYAWLCGHEFKEDKGKSGSPSPRRLEDYDDIRRQLAQSEERVAKLEGALQQKTFQEEFTRKTNNEISHRLTMLEGALTEIRNRLPAQEYVQDGLTARELKQIIACVDSALLSSSKTN